jgi:hypothetical protein
MKRFAFALLALVLTAGCSDSSSDEAECTVTCKDGYRTTLEGSSCLVELLRVLATLSSQHGSCNSEAR